MITKFFGHKTRPGRYARLEAQLHDILTALTAIETALISLSCRPAPAGIAIPFPPIGGNGNAAEEELAIPADVLNEWFLGEGGER